MNYISYFGFNGYTLFTLTLLNSDYIVEADETKRESVKISPINLTVDSSIMNQY